MKLYRHIIALLIWIIVSVAYGQTNVNNQVQLAEQKVKIDNLEIELKELKEEMSTSHDKIEKSMDDKFEVKKENLSNRESSIDWWLSILGLWLTFSGIGIPVAGYILRKKIYKEAAKQRQEAEGKIDDFVRKAQSQVNQFVIEAEACVGNIRNNEKKSREITESLRLASEVASNPESSKEQKNEASEKLKNVESDKNASPFEQDMAKALDLYLSGEYEASISLNQSIIEQYYAQITMLQAAEIYFRLANAYANLDSYIDSVFYYKKVIDIIPDKPVVYNNCGCSLGNEANKNDYEAEALYLEAFEMFNKALVINPNYADAYYNWGYYLSKLAKRRTSVDDAQLRFNDAIDKYNRAIDIKPDFWEAYNNIGMIQLIQSRNKQGEEEILILDHAKQLLEKGESIISGSCSYNLACVYSRLGQKDHAVNCLKASLEFNSNRSYDDVKNDPDFVNIKDTPEFHKILAQLNTPQ